MNVGGVLGAGLLASVVMGMVEMVFEAMGGTGFLILNLDNLTTKSAPQTTGSWYRRFGGRDRQFEMRGKIDYALFELSVVDMSTKLLVARSLR